MAWEVLFHDQFVPEFQDLAADVQDELLACALVLAERGPSLGRPHVGTVSGAGHANLKELRFTAGGGVWRVAFAFDPARRAVLLVAGDKSGGSQARFYRAWIRKADARLAQWLDSVSHERKEG